MNSGGINVAWSCDDAEQVGVSKTPTLLGMEAFTAQVLQCATAGAQSLPNQDSKRFNNSEQGREQKRFEQQDISNFHCVAKAPD